MSQLYCIRLCKHTLCLKRIIKELKKPTFILMTKKEVIEHR